MINVSIDMPGSGRVYGKTCELGIEDRQVYKG